LNNKGLSIEDVRSHGEDVQSFVGLFKNYGSGHAEGEREVIFAILCGYILWTAPNQNVGKVNR